MALVLFCSRMHAGHNLVPVTTEQGVSRSMKDLMRRARQAKEMDRKSRRQKKEILKKRSQYWIIKDKPINYVTAFCV